MSSYFIPLALLVLFCYHVDSKGSEGNYTQVRKDNLEQLGYDGIVEFGNGTDDISIKLTTANKGKTMGLAVKLTEAANGVLSFNVEYGVQSKKCLNTTTTQFHFGEQYGAWSPDSPYFRVLMMQGTADPVVPFKLEKDLRITVDPSSKVLTVRCGDEHNSVKDAIINSEKTKQSTFYTPQFYLDSWSETGKGCKTPKADQFVKVILHNSELSTKTAGRPPKDLAKNLTIAFPVSKSKADKVKSLLIELAGRWTNQLKNKALVVSLLPYADTTLPGNWGPFHGTKALKTAINTAFGPPNNETQLKAVSEYAGRTLTKDDYFFLVAPDAKLYVKPHTRKQDAKEAGQIFKKNQNVHKIGKAGAGGPNLQPRDIGEYGKHVVNFGGATAESIVAYFGD